MELTRHVWRLFPSYLLELVVFGRSGIADEDDLTRIRYFSVRLF